MADINRFAQDSLLWGYDTLTTGSNGQQTVNASTGNVSGMKAYKDGQAIMPTDNLTGYGVTTTDRSIVDSLAKTNPNIAINDPPGGPMTIFASGNLTGWPVIYDVIGMSGPETKFVMPGYLDPGQITYYNTDIPGIPRYKTPYEKWVDQTYAQASTPQPAPAVTPPPVAAIPPPPVMADNPSAPTPVAAPIAPIAPTSPATPAGSSAADLAANNQADQRRIRRTAADNTNLIGINDTNSQTFYKSLLGS